MHSSTTSSAPCSTAGPTSSSTPSFSCLPTGCVSRASRNPSPTRGLYTSSADPSTCLPQFSAQSPLFFSEGPERLEPESPRRGYISSLQLCSMTRLSEQDQVEREGIEMWRGCNSHSMNFELSSGLQETLDTWCLSPRSKELEGGLIIRRDQAGGYELEPVNNPLSLSNIGPFLLFDDAGLDVAPGPRWRQALTLDMIHDHQAADAQVWLEGAIFENTLPQDNHPLSHSDEQSMNFYNDVAWWNQELRPSIEQDHRASNTNIYPDEAIFEDPSPPDNHSIGYHEEWSMDMNDRIVARQLGSECIRGQSRGSDMDIPFHETALNVYFSSPFRFSTKTYNAALSDMLQPSPDNSSLHLFEEQGMDIYDVVWNQRTSPWVRHEHRSSNMEIYFDEAVPEAYEYPSSPLKPDLQPNKASLSYILQSPPAEDINDRSPPSSPTKYRYTSPKKNIGHHFRPLYFDEAMPEAYTPSPVMPSIKMHTAPVSHILQSPPAEEINDRSPPPSPRKPKDISPDENVDDGGFSPGPFRVPPSDIYARGLTEPRSLVGGPIETTSSTPRATKRKPGRPPGSHNKKKNLSASQSKKIATTALKRIEAFRKRTSTQAELPMTADSQEGNARKRRGKNRAEFKSDHDSEEQPRRESGVFERRLNVIGRIKADTGRKDMEHRGEDQENQENWERITYDPDL